MLLFSINRIFFDSDGRRAAFIFLNQEKKRDYRRAGLLRPSEVVGTEVDEPRARRVDIEVADVHMGKTEYAGKTLEELGKMIGFGLWS